MSSTAIEYISDSYAQTQEAQAERLYSEFVLPILQKEGAKRVLDAGCGTGAGVELLRGQGIEAHGLDLPFMRPYWPEHRMEYLLVADARDIPFPDNHFDAIISFAVIEHLGTSPTETCLLQPGYQEARRQYARELLRVIKPGGTISVSCPNKSFPLDVQHGPSSDCALHQARERLFDRRRVHIHTTWGKNHLLSYKETERLFMEAGASEFEALPISKYSGFAGFQGGLGKRIVQSYIAHLPSWLLTSCFNPYMLAMVRK